MLVCHKKIVSVDLILSAYGFNHSSRFYSDLVGFIEDVQQTRLSTSINIMDIKWHSLPQILLHDNHKLDTGRCHPLLLEEVHLLAQSGDKRCPIGREPLTHFRDCISHFLEEHHDEIDERLATSDQENLEQELRQVLGVDEQILNYPQITNKNKTLIFCLALLTNYVLSSYYSTHIDSDSDKHKSDAFLICFIALSIIEKIMGSYIDSVRSYGWN